MWFVYISGHGIREFDESGQDEMTEYVKTALDIHQPDAITVIEGKDITGEVMNG